MAIDGTGSITGSTGSSAKTATSSSSATLAGNFETFLTLLTTQLQNQNPLDPLDTNQFTQQLVQFAGVEQQLKTNDTLGSILTATQTSSADSCSSAMNPRPKCTNSRCGMSSQQMARDLPYDAL